MWLKGTPANHINWLYHTPRWFTVLCQQRGWACHCGSGMHPRRCQKHPWAYRMHVLELNHDLLLDTVSELEDALEALKEIP